MGQEKYSSEFRKALYRTLIEEHGEDTQLCVVSEECGELITALSHWRRGRISREAVLRELADVSIMVEQATLIMTEGAAMKPEDALDEKLDKLCKFAGVYPDNVEEGKYETV